MREYIISLVVMVLWIFGEFVCIRIEEFGQMFGPLIFWFIYYFNRINKKSKRLFGFPFGGCTQENVKNNKNNRSSSRSNNQT